MFRRTSITLLALAVCTAFVAAPAAGDGVGPPPPPSGPFPWNNGWQIGSPTDPIEVSHDPNGPPWRKLLEVPTFFPFSSVFPVHEHIVPVPPATGPANPWIDWHEHILTPGWEWVSGTIHDASGTPVPGLTVSPLPDPNIWFDFDPLPFNQPITIWKEIHCVNPNGCEPGFIDIEEYPTVTPVPVAAAVGLPMLLCLGVTYKLRRKRTAV